MGMFHLMQTSQPHVDQLGPALIIDQHIRGLDVPVHHVAAAGMGQRFGNLLGIRDDLGQRQRALPLDPIPQIFPLNEFQHDVVPAAVFTDIVDTGNIFMIQSRRRLSLVVESAYGLVVIGKMGQQDLDGHRTAQGGVCPAKDGPHPAPADELVQLEVVQPLALQHAAQLAGANATAG